MFKQYRLGGVAFLTVMCISITQQSFAQIPVVGLPNSCSGYRAGLANGTIVPEVEIAMARPYLWSGLGAVAGYAGLATGPIAWGLAALSGSVSVVAAPVILVGAGGYGLYRGYKDYSKIRCMEVAVALRANANRAIESKVSVYQGGMGAKQEQVEVTQDNKMLKSKGGGAK